MQGVALPSQNVARISGRSSEIESRSRMVSGLVIPSIFFAAGRAADLKEGGWRPLFWGTDLARLDFRGGSTAGQGWVVEDDALIRK